MASLARGHAEGIGGITVKQVACYTITTVDFPLNIGSSKSLS